jgi:hypothetical protein
MNRNCPTLRCGIAGIPAIASAPQRTIEAQSNRRGMPLSACCDQQRRTAACRSFGSAAADFRPTDELGSRGEAEHAA